MTHEFVYIYIRVLLLFLLLFFLFRVSLQIFIRQNNRCVGKGEKIVNLLTRVIKKEMKMIRLLFSHK